MMSKELINKVIKELSEELKSKYPDYHGIYLFGSQARGDAGENSDYDLAITFTKKIDLYFKDEIRRIIARSMTEHELILDCVIFNISDLINPTTPLRANVREEGIFYG